MAVRQGYGKIAGTDALVFAYDTGDTRNSYKGEPTTNLLPEGVAAAHDAGSGNAVTVTDATNEKGPGWKKVTITARGSNFRTLQWTYIVMSANTLYCHSAVFDWGNMRGKNYFIYFDGNGTGTRAYYRPGDYINQGSGDINSTMPDGKFAGTITHTASHTHAFFIGNYTINTSGLNDYFYYKEFQVEVNSHPTSYTTGTRSATQGLLDLAGTRTIGLSSVSFDSNAQMTFDGTNDLIDVSYYSTVNNSLSRSWEVVVRPTTSLTYAGIFGHKIGYGCSYYCNGGIYLWYGNWAFNWYDNAAYQFLDSSVAATANVYAHIVGTYDASDQKPRIYVNGQLRATYGSSTNMNYGGETYVLDIGWNSKDGGQHYLQGQIPVAKYYSNKALTADEVRNNYNQYRTRFNI